MIIPTLFRGSWNTTWLSDWYIFDYVKAPYNCGCCARRAVTSAWVGVYWSCPQESTTVWPSFNLYQGITASDVELGVCYDCCLSSWTTNSISPNNRLKDSAMVGWSCVIATLASKFATTLWCISNTTGMNNDSCAKCWEYNSTQTSKLPCNTPTLFVGS